ncbi:GNAT family N-acetyltransferase [Devosia sp.]|uniref:GNAT family N-acetyltransferase n=1 Tax=Devosia sp. TaxID=1871048 RepID=UPI003BAB41B3
MTGYVLRRLATDADWQAMHAIRRDTLFAPGRHADTVVYDENHPHDRADGHVPFLLELDGRPIGVVRLDFHRETAVVRLVGMLTAEQGRGHGRMLDALAVHEAKRRGVRLLQVNAARTALGFYEKNGWQQQVWDAEELVGIASKCVQMVKPI